MTVSATPSTTAAATAATDNTAARLPQKTLGQSDFLKLLTVQLQSQDPMKPMDNTAFIAQMASFSSLQAMTHMSTSMGSVVNSQQLTQAQSLLGKNVQLVDSNKNTVSGVVTAVNTDGSSAPTIEVNGQNYDLSTVRVVSQPAATTSNSTNSTSNS